VDNIGYTLVQLVLFNEGRKKTFKFEKSRKRRAVFFPAFTREKIELQYMRYNFHIMARDLKKTIKEVFGVSAI
jgi:hypothetical protein